MKLLKKIGASLFILSLASLIFVEPVFAGDKENKGSISTKVTDDDETDKKINKLANQVDGTTIIYDNKDVIQTNIGDDDKAANGEENSKSPNNASEDPQITMDKKEEPGSPGKNENTLKKDDDVADNKAQAKDEKPKEENSKKPQATVKPVENLENLAKEKLNENAGLNPDKRAQLEEKTKAIVDSYNKKIEATSDPEKKEELKKEASRKIESAVDDKLNDKPKDKGGKDKAGKNLADAENIKTDRKPETVDLREKESSRHRLSSILGSVTVLAICTAFFIALKNRK